MSTKKSPRVKKRLPAKAPRELLAEIIASADPDDIIAAASSLSLRTFLEEAWSVLIPGDPFQGNWHIDMMCEHLEALFRGEFDDLLINVPPRHTKSNTCAVMFGAWCWIKDPTLRIMGASYSSEGLSMRDSREMRILVESPWYQARWPMRLSDDQNVKSRWENDKRGWRMATSTRGGATGEGADILIVDDPHNVTEGESEVERKQVLDWYNVTMPTRTGRGGRRKTVVVMQRVQEADLSADIISKMAASNGRSVHMCLPQEYEAGHSKWWSGATIVDPRKEDGELLWPARFPREFVEIQRTVKMTPYAYAGQMQQRPAPLEGGMFDPAKWGFYDKEFALILAEAEDKCWSWDMTFKDLKAASASFVVGQPWVRIGANFYLGPQVRARMGFTDTKAAVKLGAATFPTIHWKLIEDKANGSAIIDDLKPTLGGLDPVEPIGSKDERAAVVEPYQRGGNIFLPNPRSFPWVVGYIEEFRNFPNGAHDDQVDATSQAINWLLKRFNKKSGGSVTTVTKSTHRGFAEPRYHDPRGEEPPPPPPRSERGDRQ